MQNAGTLVDTERLVFAEHWQAQAFAMWVAALERLVTEKGLTESPALLAKKEAWADAYRHTPHGKPVVLPSSD